MPLPYENASSGKAATEDMQRILRGFGASSFGHMEDFEKGEVLVQFTYRSVPVTIRASSKGYAAMWLREYPWHSRRRVSEAEHQFKALRIGQVAVYSMLRDWIKGQVTAVESGLLPFNAAFLAQLVLQNGETVMERIERGGDVLALPSPQGPK